MRKLTPLLFGILLHLTAQNLNAQHYDPAESMYCGLHFPVYADYLFWNVCRSDLDYSDNLGNVFYLNPEYQSGWRVGFRIAQGNIDIGARYTSYFNTITALPEGDNFPDAARINYDTDWQIADFELGYSFYFFCGNALLRPFAGAKLAWLDEVFERQFDEFERQEISFKGAGPYVGLDGRFLLLSFNFCNIRVPIAIKSRLGLSILTTRFQRDPCPLIDCFYAPVLEALVALEFGGSKYCGVTPFLLIGYENQSWLTKQFFDLGGTATLGLGGLVTRLTLDY